MYAVESVGRRDDIKNVRTMDDRYGLTCQKN